jgi:flagellar biosynthesis protein FlhF
MQLKVIRAETMPAALRAVRAALGEEALILSSRRIAGGIEVTAASEPPADESLPPPLEPLRVAPPRAPCALAAHGVPAPLAARIAEAKLARVLAFGPLPLGHEHPALLLAGPPGAGKTLTAAKLAARLCLAGESPMVITADGRRAGAIEQLAAFTKLLELDLLVAPHPATLARALARRDRQPVIIDGAGLDVFDPADAETLGATASAANASIGLVLPANMDAEEAADIAALHRRLGAAFLIPTRLDQSRRLGAVVTAAAQGLTIAGFGAGSSVADGFLDPDPAILEQRLARAPAQAQAHAGAPP